MWFKDQQFGYGREEFFTDMGVNIYEGCFKDGLKYGNGVFTWANGTNFKGQFLNDCMHGEGIMTFHDGKRYVGGWENNEMHGDGKFTWPDGRWYEGKYYYGLKNGPGTFEIKEESEIENSEGETEYVPKVTRYEGNWSQGRQNGIGTIIVIINDKLAHKKTGTWEKGMFMFWSKD